jgi:hypothetical protein
MNNKILNKTIISKALLFLFLFLQAFALIHISGHKFNFETFPVFAQEETDPLHDSDSGCIMLRFLSLNQENSVFGTSFASYISSHIITIPPFTDEYISVFLLNNCNRAPPLFL